MLVLCSRNARPQKDGQGAARCPSCSQNAHTKKVLVRCAQSRATSAIPLTKDKKDWKALAIHDASTDVLSRVFAATGHRAEVRVKKAGI